MAAPGSGMRMGKRISISSASLAEYDPRRVLTTAKYLSDFQVAKLTFFFENIFDADKNGRLDENDLVGIAKRIADYNGFSADSSEAAHVIGVHKIFFECLADQTKAEKAAVTEEGDDDVIMDWDEARKSAPEEGVSVNLDQWLNMWGKLCHGSAGLSDFPVWVQLLPKIYFRVVDQDRDGVLEKSELRNFYEKFVGVEKGDLDQVTEEGYRVMTANGDYKLDLTQYNFVFANFLLGKGKYGPGKYLFGCFDNSEIQETYKVKYNDDDGPDY